ncbi:hypothetical protein GY45DRAFT_1034962 [Cubamyces sp. BRFM 1775]|nr:hypothetical protein GY45DRAFT_1034962 [Cubamyces sp. BRFM 1775]
MFYDSSNAVNTSTNVKKHQHSPQSYSTFTWKTNDVLSAISYTICPTHGPTPTRAPDPSSIFLVRLAQKPESLRPRPRARLPLCADTFDTHHASLRIRAARFVRPRTPRYPACHLSKATGCHPGTRRAKARPTARPHRSRERAQANLIIQ